MKLVNLKRKVTTMSKSTKTTEAPKEQGPKLQLKESFSKLYNTIMFVGPGIGAYILWFSGQTTSLKVLAVVLAIDAAAHAYKLVAVVK